MQVTRFANVWIWINPIRGFSFMKNAFTQILTYAKKLIPFFLSALLLVLLLKQLALYPWMTSIFQSMMPVFGGVLIALFLQPFIDKLEKYVSDKIAGAAENPGVLQDMRQDQSVELSGNTATLNNNIETTRNITTNNSAEPSGNTISGNVISDNRLSEKARLPRPGAYRVQVGLYRNWVYAQRLLDELLAAGYPAYLDESGPYIRVQVGPFMTLMEAVRMERKLRRDGYDTLVIRGK